MSNYIDEIKEVRTDLEYAKSVLLELAISGRCRLKVSRGLISVLGLAIAVISTLTATAPEKNQLLSVISAVAGAIITWWNSIQNPATVRDYVVSLNTLINKIDALIRSNKVEFLANEQQLKEDSKKAKEVFEDFQVKAAKLMARAVPLTTKQLIRNNSSTISLYEYHRLRWGNKNSM